MEPHQNAFCPVHLADAEHCLLLFQIIQLPAVDLKQPSLFGLYLVLFPTQVSISLCALW